MSEVGGRNGFNKWDVSWKEISDVVVCKHELIHAETLHNSVVGGYQVIIKDMSDFVPDDMNIKRLQYELYRYSKLVHECVATYCSIKQLDKHLIPKYVETLNNEYKEYYYIFSRVLDKHFKSTYIQIVVAFRIATVCLNIDIYKELLMMLKGNLVKLVRKLMPDYRFLTLLESLDDKFLQTMNKHIAELVCNLIKENKLPEEFDYQSDAHWSKLTLEDLRQLNEEISSRIWTFISDEYVGFKVLSRAEYKRIEFQVTVFLRYLNIKYHVPIMKKSLIANCQIKGLTLDINDYFFINYINSSTINNKRRMVYTEPVTKDKIPEFYPKNHSLLNQSTYIHSGMVYNSDINDNWFNVRTRDKDYLISGFCINKDIMKSLHMNIDDLFVVGLLGRAYLGKDNKTSSSIIYLDKLINEFLGGAPVQNNSNMQFNRIYYMHGDFSYWMKFLLDVNDLKTFVMKFHDENATHHKLLKKKHKSKEKDNQYFGMIVLYSESLPGVFVRCYNKMIFDRVLLFLMELISNGIIEVDESNNRRIVEKNVIQAFKAIEAIWEEY
ncbi:hypothetical protein [Clostridium saccharoperbutylacetonicum]|uniref:hypothetical protein n=1 Tax=Clostridium saccharoperbutylacetonicum TaxID=36745 RepID=UPI0009839CC2|nr:hypothetical protein [Clostridium saccharoperbutylacetonicum]AQR93409.1 hypothetical protein CLSAP_07070 [Clostridium saccharoperbutylacetonicum]NSB29106.1 hypothetical protein [Clostridium saccharoperbutylacetonicum]